MNKDKGKCVLCKGTGMMFHSVHCTYCNCTGEWNQLAENYLNNHICQCIIFDRQNCPVCKKKCHHVPSGTPKNIIAPPSGGQSNYKNWDNKEKEIELEMENFA